MRRWLLPAVVGFTAITTTTPLAQAKIQHNFESVIGEVPGEGPGGKSVPTPGPLDEANSLTVHAEDLYVAERLAGEQATRSRTDQFAPSMSKPGQYEFVSQLPPQSEPSQWLFAGIAFRTVAGETEMYIGQLRANPAGGPGPTGLNVFDAGSCGTLECASLQTLWTGAEAPNPPFASVDRVAVDHSTAPGDWASGDVFVADGAAEGAEHVVIDIFEPQAGGSEKYVGQVTEASGPMAVSGFNGDLVVGDTVFRPEEEGPKKGKYAFLCQLVPPGGPLAGVGAVAVDDSTIGTFAGEIYLDGSGPVYEFGPECGFRSAITSVPKEGVRGGLKGQAEEVPLAAGSLAVDPVSHRVFVGQRGVVDVFGPDAVVPDVTTEAPSNLALGTDPETGATSWELKPTGSVNPLGEGAASCWFVWGLTELFGHEAPCGALVPDGGAPVSVNGSLTGLEPDTAYVYRLQAQNSHGTNPGEETENYRFTTPGPGLRHESVSEVSSSSASFEGTVAPHDAPVEEHDLQAVTSSPTSYYFQYSTQPTSVCAAEPSACTSVPSAPVSVGSGTADVPVSQHTTGLAPNTTYHYRLVAINEALPLTKPGVLTAFYGADRTFTTQGPGGPVVLPDGRAWELVSPEDKKGARVLPSGQASAGGSAFTFLTNNPTEPEPKGAGAHGLQVLASRVAPGQWSSFDINLSRSSPEGTVANNFREYRYFSEDLGLGVVESEGPFSIPEGWHQNEHGEWERIVEASPVPSERTPYLRHNATCASAPATCFQPLLDSQDVTSGAKYEGPLETFGAANAVAATPDTSHVIIDSGVPLTTGPPPVTLVSRGLYEWSAAKLPAERLVLVNVLEHGELGPAATVALSSDGSRVFFGGCGTNAGSFECGSYFVRDVSRGETARLDLTEGGAPPNFGKGAFGGASTDGSRAFFTDSVGLKKDSGVNGRDLYVCELGPEAVGPPKCALTDLTPVPAPGEPGAREDAQVSHALGVSADGTYVYFLAKGVLTAGATPAASLQSGQENLYVAHQHEGKWTTSFIASPSGVGLTHVPSPDGRWFAFSAENALTGYDNRDAKTGSLDSEVYLYDAEAGKLVCASCNPSGARPIGPAVVPASGHETPVGDAGNESLFGAGGSRSLFDNGRLFFDSGDALVPQDTSGNLDVYESEPAGVGNCIAADPTFNAASGACVALISSGRASGESVFSEASANASDVFFTTSERLLPGKDIDTAVDVYDAHECTSASPCAPAEEPAQEECTSAAACRTVPAAQPSIFGAPSSATFSGLGNIAAEAPTSGPPPERKTAAQIRKERLAKALKACKKKHGARRRACERNAHVRYGPPKSRKASTKQHRAPTSSSRTGG
jgi:hypothetical protein